jgi:hypothetical protein
MNVKTVVAVALAFGLVSLTGCAGMKSKDSSAYAPAPTNSGASAALSSRIADEVDVNYVEQVNKDANEKGWLVLWLNPPQPNQTAHD